MKEPECTVHPIHFEDHDPRDFERLVFAYLLRSDRWQTLEWYGQVGSDLGRDIWGVRDRDGYKKPKVCIQCANRRRIPYAKVSRDIDKAVKGSSGIPDEFLLVTGGSVSAGLRDKIKKHAAAKGIQICEIWSGAEFEERLRAKAESLLKRFVNGMPFPDARGEIKALLASMDATSDEEILALMASLFDRPAFYTPFHSESSIPAFKKAITDTIEALNTGIHRLRDGTEIRRIPNRHQISDPEIRRELTRVEGMLCALRARHDEFVKSDDIRPCECGDPDCSTFMISPRGAREMDSLRLQILRAFHKVYPQFDVHLWRGFGY